MPIWQPEAFAAVPFSPSPFSLLARSSMTPGKLLQDVFHLSNMRFSISGVEHFFLLTSLPYCVIWGLFTFLYIFVTKTKIGFRSGLLGGVDDKKSLFWRSKYRWSGLVCPIKSERRILGMLKRPDVGAERLWGPLHTATPRLHSTTRFWWQEGQKCLRLQNQQIFVTAFSTLDPCR